MVASSRRTALNGILALIPDGGDDPNYIPIGLLRSNGEHNRRGEAVPS
ncbi:MAG TPA: hypothetical protein VN494_12120 [Patescibacteria group bacterium]|nr:hypothetical protein [Patescibacteria group bacterium]